MGYRQSDSLIVPKKVGNAARGKGATQNRSFRGHISRAQERRYGERKKVNNKAITTEMPQPHRKVF